MSLGDGEGQGGLVCRYPRNCKESVMTGQLNINIHNGILLSHKKSGILPFVTTWIDLEGIMLKKINQTEKGKYCMLSLGCGI